MAPTGTPTSHPLEDQDGLPAPPGPPSGAGEPRRSEALEAELAALEAILPAASRPPAERTDATPGDETCRP